MTQRHRLRAVIGVLGSSPLCAALDVIVGLRGVCEMGVGCVIAYCVIAYTLQAGRARRGARTRDGLQSMFFFFADCFILVHTNHLESDSPNLKAWRVKVNLVGQAGGPQEAG